MLNNIVRYVYYLFLNLGKYFSLSYFFLSSILFLVVLKCFSFKSQLSLITLFPIPCHLYYLSMCVYIYVCVCVLKVDKKRGQRVYYILTRLDCILVLYGIS